MFEKTRIWSLRPQMPLDVLDRYAGLPALIAQLLYNRGLTGAEEINDFLGEKPPLTADPLLMKGVREAVGRLRQAVVAKETVAVYGDYDADGITATALLSEALGALGITVVPYIPSRAEGYGLHAGALRDLAEQGIRLAITADCGTNSATEVAAGKRAGIDVIVTDHHRIEGALPEAIAVINPRQDGCEYPYKELAAVGVALKLAQAAIRQIGLTPGGNVRALGDGMLELAALGTVADVAPLLGENRALVRRGLGVLNNSSRPGVRALLAAARVPGTVDASTIGFALAPRLNAAGRMQDASTAYQLLVTGSADEASALARDLELANQQRQRLTADVLSRAREQVSAGEALPTALFAAAPDFPAGIVGLVAGRLSEEFGRPAFVVEVGEDECRGSARGVNGFNVAEALGSCRDLLTRFGGHAQAAGFALPVVNLSGLRDRLEMVAREHLGAADVGPRLVVDAETRLSVIDDSFYVSLCALAPFGHGNPNPVFMTRRVKVASARVVGREEPGHLRLQLYDGERYWPAIGFGMGQAASRLAAHIDIVYTVELNEWDGRRSLELRLKDWRPS